MNTTHKDNDTLRLKHSVHHPLLRSKGWHHSFLLFSSVILFLSTLVGCAPSTEDLEAGGYTPSLPPVTRPPTPPSTENLQASDQTPSLPPATRLLPSPSTENLENGQQNLFRLIDAEVGDWPTDANGNYYGHGDISFTARDAAKFGLLYLNHGGYEGNQVLSADWVRESLQTYSKGLYDNRLGSYFRDIGYGYLWWSARAGDHHFNYAWGHGGNLIILLDELDMVIVTTANPLHGVWGQEAWEKEGAIIDLVGWFIESLPGE